MFASINWVSEEYDITHYKSDCLHLQQKEVISQRQPPNCHQCAYGSTTSESCNPPFSFHRNLKISQAEKYPDSRKKIVYTAKLSGFKISGDTTKPSSFYFGFAHLCINGKTNPVLKRSGFVTNPEQFPLV